MYSIKDEGFCEYLEVIVDDLDDSQVKGIAKQLFDKGVTTLSEKQEYTLKNGISDYILEKCPNCGEEINFADMPFAVDNNLCNSCQQDWDKNYTD